MVQLQIMRGKGKKRKNVKCVDMTFKRRCPASDRVPE